MPARVPRRVFSPSFVVTLAALPVIPACQHESGPPVHYNPPPPPEPDAGLVIPPVDAGAASEVPPPIAIDAGASRRAEESWTGRREGNACNVSRHVTCPPQVHCNPPPPAPYPCPKDLPPSVDFFTITPSDEGCVAEGLQTFGTPSCPPNAHCNPPPPRQLRVAVACPK